MNLFRKVVASVALAALVVSTAAPSVSAYTAEDLTAAQGLAAAGVINNHSNAADFNLDSPVLRQETAKIAVNLDSSVSMKTTCDNEFADVTATTPNNWVCGYAEALLDAGKLSANTNFNPETNVTKSEATKMMLEAAGCTDVYTNASNWQAETVAYASANGIIPSYTDYNTPATRGFVFQVAYNAMQKCPIEEVACDSVMEALGICTVDNGNTTDNTNSGSTDNGNTTDNNTTSDLMVKLNSDNLADGTQIPNNGVVRFAKVDFTAGNEDASINTVTLTKKTLASVPTGTRVWFEKNGKRVSGKAAFSSENEAIVSFAPAYVVKAGETETLDLYVSLNTASGNDFQFEGIVSSASVNVNGSFVTPLLTTAAYTVAPTVITPITGAQVTYNDLENPLELGKFTVQNADTNPDTRDLEFKSIMLRQNGNADLVNLSDVYLERNGQKVSTNATIDGKYITFELNDIVKDGTTATYYVKGLVSNVDNNAGDTYQFVLKKDTDMNISEVNNGFRSTVYTVLNTTVASNVNLRSYLVNGSDVVFERDDSVELSNNVAKGTNNVTLMKGVIKTTTPVTLEDPTIGFTLPGGNTPDQLFNTVYLKIGSTVMTWSPQSTDTSASFLGLASLQAGETPVEIYANIKDTAPTTTFKFNDLRLSNFATAEYTSNQNTVNSSVGTISAVSVSIDTTQLSATKTDGLGNTTIAAGSKNVLLNTLSLKVTQGNPVSIANPVYTITYTGPAQNNVFLTLYANGTAVNTQTLNAASPATITFQNLSEIVDENPLELSIKADFSDAFNAGTISAKLTNMDITDSLTSVNVAMPTISNSALFTVAQANGVLATSDNNPKTQLLLAGNQAEKLLAFRVKAENDDIKLRDLTFNGTNLDALSNFKVVDANGNEVATSTSENATQVLFTNINTTDEITKDTTKTYYLVADVNLNTSNTTVTVSLDGTNSNIKGSNGTTYAMDTTNVATVTSNTHRVEENLAVVAQEANPSKEVANSAIRFSITATGKDQVTLSDITVNANLSGYTGMTNFKIYKDSVNTQNLVGTVAYANNADTVIPATALKTIDAGSTNHYILVVEGAVVDSTANSSDWTISIKDSNVNLGAGNVAAATYDNMGTFPITETK